MSTHTGKETFLRGGPPPSGSRPKRMTALQAHVAFFDADNDGIIWPTDTYIACRSLKFSIVLAILNSIFIHLGLSYLTWGHLIPDPFFRIRVDRIHKAKHGSDTSAYTILGEFDNHRFDYFFDTWSDPPHTHLNLRQIIKLVRGNCGPYDPFGWISQIGEWFATYLLLWPTDPRGIAREDLRSVYNGAIFYQISGRRPPQY